MYLQLQALEIVRDKPFYSILLANHGRIHILFRASALVFPSSTSSSSNNNRRQRYKFVSSPWSMSPILIVFVCQFTFHNKTTHIKRRVKLHCCRPACSHPNRAGNAIISKNCIAIASKKLLL